MATQQRWIPTYDWLASGDGEKVWSRVLSIGRLHPLTAREQARDNETLFVIIPGNPGHCQFYETFAKYLHDRDPSTTSVWVLSHVGHVRVPPELLSLPGYTISYKQNYLSAQTRHKAQLLLSYLPRNEKVNISLIGHSIGSYMILEFLETLVQNGVTIKKAFLLFPTLNHMSETPNGRSFLRMRKFGFNRVLDTVAPFVFCLLPDHLKRKLVRWRCGQHRNSIGPHAEADSKVIEAAADLFHSDVVAQALEMGCDEMKNVGDVNVTAMNTFGDKLVIVYATNDGWCPLSYRDKLLERWPNVKTIVCGSADVEHAFVIFDGRYVADLVLEHL